MYVLPLAVWWTNAILTGEYEGASERSLSSAPHSSRVTMTGWAVEARAGCARSTPATVAAARRSVSTTRSATLDCAVGSTATSLTPESFAGALREPAVAATWT